MANEKLAILIAVQLFEHFITVYFQYCHLLCDFIETQY
jgi:hypothetical protein